MLKNLFKRKTYEPLPYEEEYDYNLRTEDEPPCKYQSVHHGLRTIGLPFEPVHEEVIYIENEYDEATNRCIEENIDLIQECFAKRNFVFVYLPLLGKELAAEDIRRYHQPYVSASETDIGAEQDDTGEMASLKSSYLLDFMKNPQNRGNIAPCFARYNYSMLEYQFAGEKRTDMWVDYFDTFSFDVSEATDVRDYFECLSERVAGKLLWWSGPCSMGRRTFDDADDAFDCETEKMLAEVRYKIELLRRKGISEVVLERLVKPEVKLSRIVIRKDYSIILPDYNDMEITMTPLVKAVFLLFLKHPEGIMFKKLSDHRRELSALYDDIKGYADSSRKTFGIRRYSENIINVTDPLNNSINEKCTRIKEAFLMKFHESMAQHYFITGKRGEPKRITLPRELVVWER